MSFSTKPQSDLEEILSYSASLEISASNRTLEQLCSLASYAKSGGARLVLTEASALSKQSICDIASYGKGHVSFKD